MQAPRVDQTQIDAMTTILNDLDGCKKEEHFIEIGKSESRMANGSSRLEHIRHMQTQHSLSLDNVYDAMNAITLEQAVILYNARYVV